MLKRSATLLVTVFFAILATSKDKKNEIMPELILQARYINVIVDPDAGVSVSNPAENRIAQRDVETALEKWGRFKMTMDSTNADLILVVRKAGKPIKQTIGVPPNDRPVIVSPAALTT